MKLGRTVRTGERRDVGVAFVTLFGLVGSHAVLETARDALFLSSIPAARLPFVYLAIAGVSLAAVQLHARIGRRWPARSALSGSIAIAAAGTFAFWALLPRLGASGLYALYIWSGVISTIALLQFWTLLGGSFSIQQAKRLYAPIGLGSVLGATAGSALAGALSGLAAAHNLVLVAAAGFAASAIAPRWLRESGAPEAEPERELGALMDAARVALQHPYARRLVGLTVLAAAVAAVADYLFKSTAAASLAPGDLVQFFAVVYATLNAASFLVQLALVQPALRRLGPLGSIAVLPLLLAAGGAGFAAAAGLTAALLVKGGDGALRHTLHRTASELLFVPLAPWARARVKALADSIGQRGGQCVASLAILVAVWLGAPPAALGIGLALLSVLWLAGLIDLRRHYLDLFRGRLDEDRIAHLLAFPELDLASLENMIAALDSDDEAQVIAAMTVLEQDRKAHLVPALILYHPSEAVVEHALALFVRAGRQNALHAVDHLVDHPSVRVRQAMVAARSVLANDERWLRMRLSEEESPEVRAAIMVNLIAAGAVVGSDARDSLDSLLAHGAVATRVALAEAIARRTAQGFEEVLIALSRAPEPAVRAAAVQAMGTARAPALLPALIATAADETTRQAASDSLAAYGEEGLVAVAAALADRDTPMQVRWQLPWIAMRFAPQEAASMLLGQLLAEWDGMVRYRTVRALEAIARSRPDVVLDAGALDGVIDGTVRRAYRYLDRRLCLQRGAERDPRRATEGHRLLCRLLADKQAHAVGRLFRLIGLAHPAEDFARIWRGLRSERRDVRDSGVELTEAVLRPPLRAAVVGLIDDTPDEARLAAAGPYHDPLVVDYEALLEQMLHSESESVRLLTVFHIGELELGRFRPHIEQLART
ncbi:MAG TPA: HEAT repeat domain-containing protein, partial [Kofleriaceae bacterium]|nr:HEAT repeat domain-containing protein [Kofleriaceae bacterium]